MCGENTSKDTNKEFTSTCKYQATAHFYLGLITHQPHTILHSTHFYFHTYKSTAKATRHTQYYTIYRICYTAPPMLISDTALRKTPPSRTTTACIPTRPSQQFHLHQMFAPTQHNTDITTGVSDRPYCTHLAVPTVYSVKVFEISSSNQSVKLHIE